MDVSIVVPARNEVSWIDETLRSIDAAAGVAWSEGVRCEIVVVDNASSDGTPRLAEALELSTPLSVIPLDRLGAARARNAGAARGSGSLLIFVDADTRLSPEALVESVRHAGAGKAAGICRLGTFDGGLRARLWWGFWNAVRRLPLPRAKAMPAFMFCTRDAFDRYGPFDESVAIGEEWPILAGVYAAEPDRFVYDARVLARSSSRRMQLVRFGFLINFFKYVWAVLDRRGRLHYPDTVR
ncbi:MAG: glycosyltransferase family A protein [Acidobacteriota bacterium]